jgi:Tfp pilus assembly protein PilF
MRYRWIVPAAVLSLCCTKPAEKPVVPAPGAEASSAPAPAPPPAAAAADPHRAAYEEAKTLINEWGGDGKKLEQAREKLMAILAADKNYAPAYVGLARVEYESGYFSGDTFDTTALGRGWKLVQHALKLDPALFDAHLTAGWISRYQGQIDSARSSIERAEELRPGTMLVKLLRAELAQAERNPTEMVRLAREVVAAESSTPREKAAAYSYLIDFYRRGGHADQADEAYREQIKLRPDSAWIHGNYAGFLLDRGQTDVAIREAEAAVRIAPYPMALNTLARALLTKADEQWNANQIQEAGKTIERIAALAGDEPEVLAGMGAFYERAAIRAKDPDMRRQALSWYEKALAKEPENRDVQRAVERLRSR